MIPYQLTRSSRKTVQLRIEPDGALTVRAPRRTPRKEIDRIVQARADWIARGQAAMREKNVARRTLSAAEQDQLRQAAREILPKETAHWAAVMGVQPAGVKITAAARRWGSCSAKNSLCFSLRLMLLPEELRAYIVVHELAHIRVKNHSAAFYAEIARFMPDYRARIAALRAFERAHPFS